MCPLIKPYFIISTVFYLVKILESNINRENHLYLQEFFSIKIVKKNI